MREILRRLMIDSLESPLPALTRRDVRLPGVANKAHAIIGMRRSGKTTYLRQIMTERLAAGAPRASLLYLNFEDERLTGLDAGGLDWLLEEFYLLHPEWRGSRQVTFLFDEIQNVDGWERFVRRVMDSERVDFLLSGSSARMLGREVATIMRGRALTPVVYPFSFREALRHAGDEPTKAWRSLPKAARSMLDNRLREYLLYGGFPEAQGLDARDRRALLQSYVDVAVLRDVIERHGVSNPTALRWLQRQLLSQPAGGFSIQKFHDTLHSQGIAVGKNTLHDYLQQLEDAFLLRTLSMHTRSERQRMVNPRKCYPIDPGLYRVYDHSGESQIGRALETAGLLELDRRGCTTAYVRTPEGYEVDFHATVPDGNRFLIQVCADVSEEHTWTREVRALQAAAKRMRGTVPLLVTLDAIPPRRELPPPLQWRCAADWLLDFSF